jgi:hypothetical protein
MLCDEISDLTSRRLTLNDFFLLSKPMIGIISKGTHKDDAVGWKGALRLWNVVPFICGTWQLKTCSQTILLRAYNEKSNPLNKINTGSGGVESCPIQKKIGVGSCALQNFDIFGVECCVLQFFWSELWVHYKFVGVDLN